MTQGSSGDGQEYGQYPQQSYPQYPQQGYFQPGYPQQAGFPMAPVEEAGSGARPGTVTAASVLGFVQAGLTLVTSVLVFATAGEFGGASIALATAQVAGVFLLIYGGVTLLLGRERWLLTAGNVVELLICLAYVAIVVVAPDFDAEDPRAARLVLVTGAVVFAVMPTISLALSSTYTVKAWLRSR